MSVSRSCSGIQWRRRVLVTSYQALTTRTARYDRYLPASRAQAVRQTTATTVPFPPFRKEFHRNSTERDEVDYIIKKNTNSKTATCTAACTPATVHSNFLLCWPLSGSANRIIQTIPGSYRRLEENSAMFRDSQGIRALRDLIHSTSHRFQK